MKLTRIDKPAIVVMVILFIASLFLVINKWDRIVPPKEFDMEQFDGYEESDTVIDSLFESIGGKEIEYVSIHCTATYEGNNLDAAGLQRIWDSRGFSRSGYHIVVDIYGELIIQGPIDDCIMEFDEMRWGVKNFNSKTIHISYVGGVDRRGRPKDTRTKAQKQSLTNVLTLIKMFCPDCKIQGHREFPNVAKACPSFDASSEYDDL